MTELELAREHLRNCQDHLGYARLNLFPYSGSKKHLRGMEVRVLAALSWVWDAQERGGYNAKRRPFELDPDQQATAQQAIALLCWHQNGAVA